MRRLLSLSLGLGLGAMLGGMVVRRIGALRRALMPWSRDHGSTRQRRTGSRRDVADRFEQMRHDAAVAAAEVERALRAEFDVPSLDGADQPSLNDRQQSRGHR